MNKLLILFLCIMLCSSCEEAQHPELKQAVIDVIEANKDSGTFSISVFGLSKEEYHAVLNYAYAKGFIVAHWQGDILTFNKHEPVNK